MRRLLSVGAVIASLIGTACSDPANGPRQMHAGTAVAAKAPPPLSVNVTSTLFDADQAGHPLLTRSDDFNGAGFATYTNVNRMTSHVADPGGWQLYIGNQSARTVRLTLAAQGIGAPDGYYYENVEVYSGCFDQNVAHVSFLSMTEGQSNGNCSFGLDFTSARTKYKLVMGPMYAGTGTATVTCTAVAGGYCASWTIVPNTASPNATVANLYHFGNNGSLVFDGVYHNTYSVTAVQ
jgi:hypothetical protein